MCCKGGKCKYIISSVCWQTKYRELFHFTNSQSFGNGDDFPVYGTIGNTNGLIILKSGAQVSLIKKSIEKNKLIKSNIGILYGVTGSKPKIYGETEESLMLPPEVIFNCKFIVTDLPNEYIGILGLDDLEK